MVLGDVPRSALVGGPVPRRWLWAMVMVLRMCSRRWASMKSFRMEYALQRSGRYYEGVFWSASAVQEGRGCSGQQGEQGGGKALAVQQRGAPWSDQPCVHVREIQSGNPLDVEAAGVGSFFQVG